MYTNYTKSSNITGLNRKKKFTSTKGTGMHPPYFVRQKNTGFESEVNLVNTKMTKYKLSKGHGNNKQFVI
jgi:hypothetical protein